LTGSTTTASRSASPSTEGKLEQKPATISYVDTNKTDAFYQVDIGVKVGEYDPIDAGRQLLALYPTVEWHRTTTPSKVNLLDTKVNADYAYGLLREYDEKGNETNPRSGTTDWGRLVMARTGLSRDCLTDQNAFEGSLSFTIKSNRTASPR
jgi:hypothetical protein